MSDDFIRRDDLHGYSDREILLLLVQEVRASLPVINRRLDSHASDLKDLKQWRSYLTGGWAAVVVWVGLIKGGKL